MRSNNHKNDFFNYFFSLFLFLCSFFYPRSFFRFSFFFVISLSLPFLYHWCVFIIFISTIIWLSFTYPYLSFPFIFLSFILSLSFSLYYFISRLFLFSSFSFISPAPPPNRSLSRRPPFNCAHLWSRRTVCGRLPCLAPPGSRARDTTAHPCLPPRPRPRLGTTRYSFFYSKDAGVVWKVAKPARAAWTGGGWAGGPSNCAGRKYCSNSCRCCFAWNVIIIDVISVEI